MREDHLHFEKPVTTEDLKSTLSRLCSMHIFSESVKKYTL